MKKIFRTLASVTVAFVMLFAVGAFAACGDENVNKNPPGNSGTPETPETPETPGNQALKDWSFDFGGGGEEVKALLDSVVTQKTDYADIDLSSELTQNCRSYHVDEKGEKLDDGYLYLLEDSDAIGADAKLNVKTGDGDISYSENKKKTVSVTKNGNTETEEIKADEYFYAFIRDWNLFTYSGNGEESNITDFSDVTFNWDGTVDESYGEWLAVSEYGSYIDEMLKSLLGGEFTVGNAVQ